MTTTYWNDWYTSLAEYRYAQMQRYNVRLSNDTPFTWNRSRWSTPGYICIIDIVGSPPESDHDDWLEMIGIPGARAGAEAYLGLSIGQKTLELTTDRFPDTRLHRPAVRSGHRIVSVTYLDGGGNEIEWPDPARFAAGGAVDCWITTAILIGYIWLLRGLAYRCARVRNSVRIRYTVGYSLTGESPHIEADAIPDQGRHAADAWGICSTIARRRPT